MAAFMLIIAGCWLTLASAQLIAWLNVSLIGELLMVAGYAVWIIIKTRQGEEPRSRLSRLFGRLVQVD